MMQNVRVPLTLKNKEAGLNGASLVGSRLQVFGGVTRTHPVAKWAPVT